MDLKKLLEELKNKNSSDYSKVLNLIQCLNKQRIKLVGDSMREMLGRPIVDGLETAILQEVKQLNEIAKLNKIDFVLEEDMEKIKIMLKSSLLDDIGREFKKQGEC